MIMSHVFEKSSMLHNAAYDSETKELTVAFVSGRVYTYKEVEKSIYEELIGVSSPGKYFNSIKARLEQK